MKHTEEQMMVKVKKVLSDLQGEYYSEENIEGVEYNKDEDVARPRGQIMPAWTAYIKEPLFDSSIFLVFSDETGEPLYIQNKHGISEIEKDANGKFITKNQ